MGHANARLRAGSGAPLGTVPSYASAATGLGRASLTERRAHLADTVRPAARARWPIIRPFLDEGVPLPVRARQPGVVLRTARRWGQRSRRGGLGALGRQSRADKGGRRALPPPLAPRVAACALQTPVPSVATIPRKGAALATAQGLHVPSDDVVHDLGRQRALAWVPLAPAGSPVYRETFDRL